jgi:hypothetical protein
MSMMSMTLLKGKLLADDDDAAEGIPIQPSCTVANANLLSTKKGAFDSFQQSTINNQQSTISNQQAPDESLQQPRWSSTMLSRITVEGEVSTKEQAGDNLQQAY